MAKSRLRVLMTTSEWPTPQSPFLVPFLVQQVKFLKQEGVDVEVFFFRGARNPLNYLKAWWRFNRTYRDAAAFDLVHAQFTQAALIPWPKRWPLVITYHGSDLLGILSLKGGLTWQGRLLVWLGKNVARFADAVIIVSRHMNKNLPSSVTPFIHPTGVDLAAIPTLSREAARARLGLPADERLALFVGSPHNPLKRYALAQESVTLLCERLPTRLILGWSRPHEEIILLMIACDALIVTSLQEGSPTIVKEALACDLPIVSVVVGDIAERLRGIEGCEIATDDRAATLADALERVLKREKRIDGRRAVAQLDERVLAQKLIEIYRSTLARTRPNSQPNSSEGEGPRPFVARAPDI